MQNNIIQTPIYLINRISKSGLDLINEIENTQTRIIEEKKNTLLLNEFWGKNNDIRVTIFNRFLTFLFSTKLSLIFIETNLMDNNWWKLNFRDLQTKDIYQHTKEFETWSKHHFGLSIFIQTEYFTRKILRSIDPSACSNATSDFKSVYETLLSKIDINYPEAKNLYNLLRLVRNTIHNDGIYRNRYSNNEIVTYKGVEYSFLHDCLIDFVTWNFLIDITNDIVQLIKEIIFNKNVANISDNIND